MSCTNAAVLPRPESFLITMFQAPDPGQRKAESGMLSSFLGQAFARERIPHCMVVDDPIFRTFRGHQRGTAAYLAEVAKCRRMSNILVVLHKNDPELLTPVLAFLNDLMARTNARVVLVYYPSVERKTIERTARAHGYELPSDIMPVAEAKELFQARKGADL